MVETKEIPIPQIRLNSGYTQPAVGLGTYNDDLHEAVRDAVSHALKFGYRCIDTAAAYGTEGPVGEGIKQSGVPRSEIFVITKVWNNNHRAQDVVKSVKQSLKDLQTDYIDLLLIHWPIAFPPGDDMNPTDSEGKIITVDNIPLSETWGAFESLVDEKIVRSIGVSNFSEHFIDEILKTSRITPAVNQIEFHPYLQRRELIKYCQDRGIQITAYSPFGNLNSVSQGVHVGKLINEEILVNLGKKYNVASTTIILSWAVALGIAVIPKSTNPRRIEENFKLIELTQDDMNQIATLDRGLRFVFTEGIIWKRPELDVFKLS